MAKGVNHTSQSGGKCRMLSVAVAWEPKQIEAINNLAKKYKTTFAAQARRLVTVALQHKSR